MTEIFSSIQGEGHFVGYPMTFIRLAGCSVTGCSIRAECDEVPWKTNERLTAAEIAARTDRAIACITGGEPTDHDLTELVSRLRADGVRVHLETSGVRPIDGIPFDWITVSPKTRDYAQRQGHTLKVVVRPGWGWRQIFELNEGTQFFHRYLQPLYSGDKPVNLAEVAAMIASSENAFSGWALSTQAHKSWGVR